MLTFFPWNPNVLFGLDGFHDKLREGSSLKSSKIYNTRALPLHWGF